MTNPIAKLVAEVAAALRAGEPVVIPTDTVYGLAALPSVSGAVDRLFELKDRPPERSIAVLVASASQAHEIATISDRTQRVAERYWPGPLTLVVPKRSDVAAGLGADDGTIGVRCPAHELARLIAAEVGPLATTSANKHGRPTPSDAAAVARHFGGAVDLVIDGGELDGQPSTVARVDEAVTVFREGPISADDLAAAAADF